MCLQCFDTVGWVSEKASGLEKLSDEVYRVDVVICLQRGADCLHMVQLMPLPSQNPIISCLKSNPDWFYLSGTRAYPGCPGKEAVKRVQ